MAEEIFVHPRVKQLLEKREDIPQQTNMWIEVRMTMLTASDVAAVLGKNPYDSRIQLLRKKVGQENRFTGNACTRYGQANEDLAGRRYAEVYNKKTYTYGLMRHRDHPWLGASPDLITADGRIVEIKCPAVSGPCV
jgi:putative phage-type endonuclease